MSIKEMPLLNYGVFNYKSFYKEQTIEFKPFTLLAGANSSGKSSIMQPLLILKQTIESPYDPGALLLNGPNIKFTSFEQMLSKTKNKEIEKRFYIQLEDKDKVRIRLTYTKTNKNIEIKMTDFNLIKNTSSDFEENMNSSEIIKKIEELEINYRVFPNCRSSIVREKCFLYYAITHNFFKTKELLFLNNLNYYLESILQELIHLPGLRGNPERNYKTTAVRDIFPGTFEKLCSKYN